MITATPGIGKALVLQSARAVPESVRDIVLDDDAGQRREFGVEAEVAGRMLAFVVPAAEFGRMGWLLNQLGPQAIIYPGMIRACIARSKTTPARMIS